MITAIVIDDELHCREVLQLLLELHCPQVQLLAVCSNAQEGIKAINEKKPSLVFLDIEMPDCNGFDMLNMVEDLSFKVVFTTAYDQYAIRAIKYSALDYLLKPIDGDELKLSVEKAMQQTETLQQIQLQDLQQNLLHPQSDFKLILTTSDGPFYLSPSDILYGEAHSNYTHFYLTRQRKMIASKTLLEYEMQLAAHGFLRVHKTYLVNMEHADKYNSTRGMLRLHTGQHIEVSRRKKDLVINALFNK